MKGKKNRKKKRNIVNVIDNKMKGLMFLWETKNPEICRIGEEGIRSFKYTHRNPIYAINAEKIVVNIYKQTMHRAYHWQVTVQAVYTTSEGDEETIEYVAENVGTLDSLDDTLKDAVDKMRIEMGLLGGKLVSYHFASEILK